MSPTLSRRTVLVTGLITALGALIAFFTRRRDPIIVVIEPTPQPTILSTPPIVSRDRWGARPPDHQALNEFGITTDPTNPAWYIYPDDLAEAYDTVAIHHSAILLSDNETIASIQDLHMDTNHWADIGYHYCIDKDGIIYQGRDIHVRGASVAGYNTGTIGVCVMGNFELDIPFTAQLTTLQTLVNWLALTYTLSHLAAHHEFNPESLCPGKNMLPYLDGLAQNAGLQRGTGGHVKPV